MLDYISRDEKHPKGELVFTHELTKDGLMELEIFDRSNVYHYDQIKSLGDDLYLAWNDGDSKMYVYVGEYKEK